MRPSAGKVAQIIQRAAISSALGNHFRWFHIGSSATAAAWQHFAAATPRAQKCRFCARNARKWGFRRAKKHKNLDFVLETPENGGSGGQKRTKTSILCSGRRESGIEREEIGIGKRNRGLPANHRARFKNLNAS